MNMASVAAGDEKRIGGYVAGSDLCPDGNPLLDPVPTSGTPDIPVVNFDIQHTPVVCLFP